MEGVLELIIACCKLRELGYDDNFYHLIYIYIYIHTYIHIYTHTHTHTHTHKSDVIYSENAFKSIVKALS